MGRVKIYKHPNDDDRTLDSYHIDMDRLRNHPNVAYIILWPYHSPLGYSKDLEEVYWSHRSGPVDEGDREKLAYFGIKVARALPKNYKKVLWGR